MPNVGKSTLFKAMTKNKVEASNFPFCTIDPNIGIVNVPDKRLEKLSEISMSKKVIPTVIKFVDIAGLVKDAHKGEGLGNKFLSNIREVDAICHLVRDFKDENVTHVSGAVDAKSDMEVINLELIFSDMSVVAKRLESLKKEIRSGDKNAIAVNDVLEKVMKILEQGHLAIEANLDVEEKFLIKELSLLTLKPVLYVVNVDEERIPPPIRRAGLTPFMKGGTKGISSISAPLCEGGQGDSKFQLLVGDSPVIAISAKIESELADLSDEETKEYMKELGISQSGLDKLIVASYKILNLITFFTSGEPETRAWTVVEGAKAPQGAGVIHTDFEEKFIRAEVVAYDDFIAYGGWNGAKDKGLMRVEGKEYIVKDGDVMFFRHGA
ncbi:redox-regulated ATPase YchF [Patescibacteria group bacterium]